MLSTPLRWVPVGEGGGGPGLFCNGGEATSSDQTLGCGDNREADGRDREKL